MLCAGIAFAGPRWGTEQTLERGSGVDMVLALDASLSMLATDARPNRLERMKEEARRLLALSAGDRVGLLAFAGRSYILTPLTVDRGALELFLDNLDPSVVGQAGSSLSRAIRQGTDLLVATQTTSDRALVDHERRRSVRAARRDHRGRGARGRSGSDGHRGRIRNGEGLDDSRAHGAGDTGEA